MLCAVRIYTRAFEECVRIGGGMGASHRTGSQTCEPASPSYMLPLRVAIILSKSMSSGKSSAIGQP
jgi:hypothetical protein